MKILSRNKICLFFIYLFIPCLLFGWGWHTHCYLTESVYRQLPERYKKELSSCLSIMLDASLIPDRDLQDYENHYYHPSTGEGKAIEKILFLCQQSLLQSMAGEVNIEELAKNLGLISAYISNISFSLNTAQDLWETDIIKTQIEKKFDQYLTAHEEEALSFKPVTPKKVSIDKETLVNFTRLSYLKYRQYKQAISDNRDSEIINLCKDNYKQAQKNIYLVWLSILQSVFSPPSTPVVSAPSSIATTPSVTIPAPAKQPKIELKPRKLTDAPLKPQKQDISVQMSTPTVIKQKTPQSVVVSSACFKIQISAPAPPPKPAKKEIVYSTTTLIQIKKAEKPKESWAVYPVDYFSKEGIGNIKTTLKEEVDKIPSTSAEQ